MAEKNRKSQSDRAKSLDKSTRSILDQQLWLRILYGMALGVLAGWLLSPEGLGIWEEELAQSIGEWLALPGVIFLGLLKMVIVPLIVCSIILGIAESASMDFLKKIGIRIIPYFILTTACAITIGIVITTIIQPGSAIDQTIAQNALNSSATAGQIPGQTFDNLSIPARIGNVLPSNPMQAQLDNNMLQLVIGSILLGIALITIPPTSGKPFKDLCMSGQVLSMKIVSWAMAIAPIAVFGLIANVVIKMGLSALTSVGLYAVCVLGGLLCMLCLYLFILKVFARISPLEFLKNIREVQLLAFSTSSSAATMPFTIQAAEEKLKLRPDIARFVVPIGATINMDGTALYQGVAAIFLCQVYGIDLSLAETILLILTTVGASIGTPATPGVGLIVLATILSGIGVPVEGLALIIGVDRILDMCRTTVNVTGDITAATLMNKWIKKDDNAPSSKGF
ncbi:MAG: dicarboxylate/amino acid:cation symporter [Micavibrio sp.]|nr:dicarboxylate/amino acid:cation symporter [Micavibrio sp.]